MLSAVKKTGLFLLPVLLWWGGATAALAQAAYQLQEGIKSSECPQGNRDSVDLKNTSDKRHTYKITTEEAVSYQMLAGGETKRIGCKYHLVPKDPTGIQSVANDVRELTYTITEDPENLRLFTLGATSIMASRKRACPDGTGLFVVNPAETNVAASVRFYDTSLEDDAFRLRRFGVPAAGRYFLGCVADENEAPRYYTVTDQSSGNSYVPPAGEIDYLDLLLRLVYRDRKKCPYIDGVENLEVRYKYSAPEKRADGTANMPLHVEFGDPKGKVTIAPGKDVFAGCSHDIKSGRAQAVRVMKISRDESFIFPKEIENVPELSGNVSLRAILAIGDCGRDYGLSIVNRNDEPVLVYLNDGSRHLVPAMTSGDGIFAGCNDRLTVKKVTYWEE